MRGLRYRSGKLVGSLAVGAASALVVTVLAGDLPIAGSERGDGDVAHPVAGASKIPPAPAGDGTTAGTSGAPLAGIADGPAVLDEHQREVADQMISVFENSKATIQYDYIRDVVDGRGYTAGRAGFCTACGDLLTVVQQYTDSQPGNPLAGYLPALRTLAAEGSDSHDGLGGLEQAWHLAADDPAFRGVQDAVSDRLYYDPAVDLAREEGLKAPLGLVILYDTAIQHGVDEGPDSLEAIAQKADASAGGSPAAGVDEQEWLGSFLTVRRDTLENPSSDATKEEWEQSVGRVDALRQLLDAGNLELSTPVTIDPFGMSYNLS